MTRAESRVAALEAARAAGSEEPHSAGVMITRPGASDERSKHRSNAERVAIRLLSQRRRLELLEPLLAMAFRSPDAFVQRRTNLKLAVLAKYSEMNEIGPMYFQGKDGAEELYELFLWFRSLADQVVQRRSTAEWLLLIRRTHFWHRSMQSPCHLHGLSSPSCAEAARRQRSRTWQGEAFVSLREFLRTCTICS